MGDGKPKRGFESSNSKRSALELDNFFMGCMRRVVGRDGIDCPISESNQDSLAVGARTQRRIHLEVGVVVANVSIDQAEMVRSNFASDTSLAALAAAHSF